MNDRQRKTWKRLIARTLAKNGIVPRRPVIQKTRPRSDDDKTELLQAVTGR